MWIDLLDNKKALTSIFGENRPKLDSFRVKEIQLNILKNSLKVVGDLSSYPEEPPVKWRKGKFNTVHVVIEFWNLKALKLVDFKELEDVDLNINQATEGVVCETNNGFYCEAELIDLLEISGYQNSQ